MNSHPRFSRPGGSAVRRVGRRRLAVLGCVAGLSQRQASAAELLGERAAEDWEWPGVFHAAEVRRRAGLAATASGPVASAAGLPGVGWGARRFPDCGFCGCHAAFAGRDRTCRWPGCHHPAARTQTDHTTPAAAGGATSAGGLGPECWPCHLAKTHTGWDVEQPEPGRFEWTAPDGHRYTVDPEPVGPIIEARPPADMGQHRPPDHPDPPPF